jgi:hypothetical protein
MFDYGDIMMNPLFNLLYFLIGMYFGLINYSKEKGIVQLSNEKKMFLEFLRKSQIDEINPGNIIDEEPNDNNNNKIEMINKYEEFINNSKESDSIKTVSRKDEKEIMTMNEMLNILDNPSQIKEMPFLKGPIIFKFLHDQCQMIYCYILLFIISIIIVFFSLTSLIFIKHYESIINNDENLSDMEKVLTRLSLGKFITSNILNYIYLLDTDIVVFFIQWGFFILYTKSSAIIDFFNSIYWAFLNKFYFSFIIVCNSTILYIFYESETVVKLNALTLLMYFFIATIVIFFLTIIIYISIELPLKKIFIYLSKKRKSIINEEDDDDDSESEEDE